MRFDHPFIPFLGRLLIVYIFAISGIGKVFSWQANIQRNWFAAAIVRRVLSWLLGWPYHGTEDDRRRLVKQLPLIGFHPRE